MLLCGQPMFEADDAVEFYKHHVGTRPEPPSRRAGREIAPDLEQVVMRCLEKDRGERPQSARRLAEMLESCRAAGGWTEEDARKWWAKHGDEVQTESEPDQASEGTVTVVTDARSSAGEGA